MIPADELLKQDEQKDLLRFVTAGSVDDGKSTLIGQLLYESKGIYEDQLAAIKDATIRKGMDGESPDMALVTDGLKAEREQGITIDVAYRYFATPKRKFIIADTPGHEQYTRNMATGASTASLSVILIDARNGVSVQSRRHAFIATLLGIGHMVVAVNKMDLVDWSREVFESIREEFSAFAAKLEARDVIFIPVSALKGDNIVSRSANMPWYQGTTLLNHLETVHVASDRNLIDLRFPVQYVSRPNSDFRGYLGTVASGAIRPGDEVMAMPSGTRSKVKQLLGVSGEISEAFPPLAATVVLEDEIDVSRGDMLAHVHNVPRVDNTFEAMIVWMAEDPMTLNRKFLIKHCARTLGGMVTDLQYQVDVNTLHRRKNVSQLKLNEIGRAVVTVNRPIAFDPYEKNRSTGAFIIIDSVTNGTVGAGMILDREPGEFLRTSGRWNAKPESENIQRRTSRVTLDERQNRLGHRGATLWLTGLTGSGKTSIAFEVERRLFDRGCMVSVIDGENARMTFSKDLDFSALANCRFLHTTGYMWDTENQKNATWKAAQVARSAGALISFDLADPLVVERYGQQFVDWIPKNVDILFGNRQEFRLMLGYEGNDSQLAVAAGRLAPVVLLKIGAEGCLLNEAGELADFPAVDTQVVDTVGAGDGFAAGFLYARAQNKSSRDCAALANRLASAIVSVEGCGLEKLHPGDILPPNN